MEKNLNVSHVSFNAIRFLETLFSIANIERCNMIKNCIANGLEYTKNSNYYYKEEDGYLKIQVVYFGTVRQETLRLKEMLPFDKIDKEKIEDKFIDCILKHSDTIVSDFKPILKTDFSWSYFIENIRSYYVLLYLFMETNNLSIDDIYDMLQEAVKNKGISKILTTLKEKIILNFNNLGKIDIFFK